MKTSWERWGDTQLLSVSFQRNTFGAWSAAVQQLSTTSVLSFCGGSALARAVQLKGRCHWTGTLSPQLGVTGTTEPPVHSNNWAELPQLSAVMSHFLGCEFRYYFLVSFSSIPFIFVIRWFNKTVLYNFQGVCFQPRGFVKESQYERAHAMG